MVSNWLKKSDKYDLNSSSEFFEIQTDEKNKFKVSIHTTFLAIHDIDTVNERFTAEFYIQSKWNAKVEFGNTVANKFLSIGSNSIPTKWKPDLSVENLISELKSEIWYKIEKFGDDIYILEMRRLKAILYEKMELECYPFDVQPLSITLISARDSLECVLLNDKDKASDVIKPTFRDSQEWYLYHYVSVEDKKIVKIDYTSDNIYHPSIRFSCVAARKPFYFIFNAFFLVFLINAISFNIFSISYKTPATRISAQNMLLLTAVSFKWVINRSLPAIAYLTLLDFYSIFAIFFMCCLASWHAIVGFYFDKMNSEWADTGFLIAAASIFIIVHVVLVLYLFFGIYGTRRYYRSMEKKFKKVLKSRKESNAAIRQIMVQV